ncbi:MAG: translesion DNA synthesis-associated protein ImuA [Lysobacter sp.]|nr:translesion DNA synthesis-associated protein ImuA [Lysobacter sp.]
MGTAIVGEIVALEALLADRRVWRGQPAGLPPATQPTGFAALDAALPTGGWPEAALTELLLPADGVGELRLLLPTLARLTRAARDIVLVAPPYVPYPDGWRQAGVDFAHVHLVDAAPRDALWAAEQCLRSGSLAAVLCWPRQADDRALRRLQVAAETGQALGFAMRDVRAAANPSPAALRLQFDPAGEVAMRLRVLKCRGGNAPAQAISLHAQPAASQGALAVEANSVASPVAASTRDLRAELHRAAGQTGNVLAFPQAAHAPRVDTESA